MACTVGAFFAQWLAGYVFSKDDGTEAMRNVSDPIREGAEGFLKVQYGAIFKIAIVLAIIILLSYSMRPENKNHVTGVGA
ncbi:AVPL2, partial [Symbiodinium microadriaticum]